MRARRATEKPCRSAVAGWAESDGAPTAPSTRHSAAAATAGLRRRKNSTVATASTAMSTRHSAHVMEVSSPMITTQARIGTRAAPGTRNGVPPLCTLRRRSSHAAAAQEKYTSSAATLAMMASGPKLLVTANAQVMVTCTMMAM